jgi:TRAP-type C4-dicarboxylate transport system permease small subunit
MSTVVERICLVLMVALVADVFLGVFSRYVLQATFQWYDEVARLCFVWIIFLGSAVAVRRRLHFRMHLVLDRFRPGPRRAAERLITLAVIAFGAILVAGGIGIAPIAHRQVTDALEISQLWFFAALPVGGALMIAFAVRELWTPGPRP